MKFDYQCDREFELVLASFYLFCSFPLNSVMFCTNVAGLLSDLVTHFLRMLGILIASIFLSFFKMQIFAMQWHILAIR